MAEGVEAHPPVDQATVEQWADLMRRGLMPPVDPDDGRLGPFGMTTDRHAVLATLLLTEEERARGLRLWHGRAQLALRREALELHRAAQETKDPAWRRRYCADGLRFAKASKGAGRAAAGEPVRPSTRARGAGRPKAAASRSSARSGDSGDSDSDPSVPALSPAARQAAQRVLDSAARRLLAERRS